MNTQSRKHGFTLIELLMVIAIIGLLIAILVPVLGMAFEVSRKAMTQRILNELDGGVHAFKANFGVYPPSAPKGTPTGTPGIGSLSRPQVGPMQTGAANLVFYLGGPAGMGWGIGGGGTLPFSTQKPDRTFGPYYETSGDMVRTQKDPTSANAVPVAYLDAFQPQGMILYFKAETATIVDPTDPAKTRKVLGEVYYVTDNNPIGVASNTDPKINYASAASVTQQQSFDQANAILMDDGVTIYKYKRSGYLLVSPGQDGYYGNLRLDTSTGNLVPVSTSDYTGKPLFDDQTN
jgi:prepilin-type N-terminal cleavage/methylation domain-containing protein